MVNRAITTGCNQQLCVCFSLSLPLVVYSVSKYIHTGIDCSFSRLLATSYWWSRLKCVVVTPVNNNKQQAKIRDGLVSQLLKLEKKKEESLEKMKKEMSAVFLIHRKKERMKDWKPTGWLPSSGFRVTSAYDKGINRNTKNKTGSTCSSCSASTHRPYLVSRKSIWESLSNSFGLWLVVIWLVGGGNGRRSRVTTFRRPVIQTGYCC